MKLRTLFVLAPLAFSLLTPLPARAAVAAMPQVSGVDGESRSMSVAAV